MGYTIKHTNSDSYLHENANGLFMMDISEGVFVFNDKVMADTALEHLTDKYSEDGIMKTNDGDFPLEEFDTVYVELTVFE